MEVKKKSKSIIVDLDGTLCNVDHRVHYVQSKPKDWGSFNRSMNLDSLHEWCFELIEAMRARSYKIIFITGRDEDYRSATEEWLKKFQVQFDLLLMRPAGDYREDSDIKEELYTNFVKLNHNVLFVVDDRKSVVERWRKLELVCLQCAPGEF